MNENLTNDLTTNDHEPSNCKVRNTADNIPNSTFATLHSRCGPGQYDSE